jgi:hypothetical protein
MQNIEQHLEAARSCRNCQFAAENNVTVGAAELRAQVEEKQKTGC